MRNKKIIKRIIIVLLSTLIIGNIAMVLVTGYLTFSNVTQLSKNENTGIEKSLAFFDKIDFDYDEFQNLYVLETVMLESSFDEHSIPGDYIISDQADADTVIMVHGLGGNRQSLYSIAVMFLERGYNVLVYDQRSAGENTAPYTTFGYLESQDLADYVDYLDKLLSPEKNIYIWGVSNGGATAGISLRHENVEKRVGSLILDCPVSGTDEMLRQEMAQMDIGIPLDFLMFSGNLYNRMKLGFSYAEASAAAYMADSEIPVLIIASTVDELTPFWMAEKLSQASPNSKLVFVDDSAHADIFFDHPEWYSENVFEFIPPQAS